MERMEDKKMERVASKDSRRDCQFEQKEAAALENCRKKPLMSSQEEHSQDVENRKFAPDDKIRVHSDDKYYSC